MRDLFARNSDLMLVFGIVTIILILFSPIPPAALDLAIIMNFGLGFTILLLTFYVAKPVEFSTFPSLLLVATLFRLSLNVAATRLILTEADAGHVIGAIGSYAVQGNFVIGLVVFTILVVVQYVVVTSGAQRVSAVAARFTLDSMPGQQINNIITQLSSPLTHEEGEAGWTERSRKGVLPFFEKVRVEVAGGLPIAYIGIVRSLDTWGVDGGRLYNEIIEVAAELNS